MADGAALQGLADLDARLVRATRRLRLLQAVSWKQGVQRDFLDRWRRGVQRLPEPEYVAEDHGEVRSELQAIASARDPELPLGLYLRRTADSWHTAALLLESVGTAAVTETFSWSRSSEMLAPSMLAPGITSLAPVAGAAKAMPQALAWNMGTTGSTLSMERMPSASALLTASECSTLERCE